MKMEKLKVGDKVCYKHYFYGELRRIEVSEVERLTKTQAILKNGDRLKNEPIECYNNKEIYYNSIGYNTKSYELLTEENILFISNFKHEIKINNWFNLKKFTFEEKEKIYNLLND